MIILWFELIFMLVIILVAAQVFTNAIEHFGQKSGISAGVTGSIFAAVATALPEATIPILAIVAGTSNVTVNQEISVGAILGAPLMLSTLSIVLMGLFGIKKRGIKGTINPERTGFKRDLNFFLAAFFLAAVAMYTPLQPILWRTLIGCGLVGIYITYLVFTCKASKSLVMSGHGVTTEDPLLLTKLGLKNSMKTIAAQSVLGFLLLLVGAKGFIYAIEGISHILNISVLLLSLLIIPIATELPEKVNSIFWIRKGKDTLAVGNITGAMVFQGTLLPALGILLTPWQPSQEVFDGIIVTFLAAAWLRWNASRKNIPILMLLVNGGLYVTYLVGTLCFAHPVLSS